MSDTRVSVVLPTLNEQPYIRDCLDSLLAQDHELFEVLVVDGGSTDATVDIASLFGRPVRLLHNPGVTAAAAMNIGMEAAAGDVIVRADAHTLYAADYVTTALEVLASSGAAVVGGPMRPVGIGRFGRAVAAVTSSPLGVGPGRFHYSEHPDDVETVYLGVFRRATVLDVGGYDEEHLQWGAEDQELNYRIRNAGGRIRLDPGISSRYFPRSKPWPLWRQYRNYGMCKASTLRKHRTLPYWRPLAPAGLVGAAVALAGVGLARRRWWIALGLPTSYTLGVALSALHLSRDPGVAPHRAFAALLICHVGYGVGFWAGMARILTGRPFDIRPRGPR